MTEYGYEIWMDGQCLMNCTNCDDWFETEDEAQEAAEDRVKDRIDDWKSEGCYDGETADDFDIRIKEREVSDEDWS